ncbi:DedA family protein [Sulfurisphaera javensis]|uniref:DedA family protein n=1 Tax=Sulfurisphaera javensis TaxID=2049879 RepID=A0AAT9GPZ7_9CREN
MIYVFQGTQGYVFLLVLMIGEGLGLPIPSEIIMPLVGYYSFLNQLNLVLGIIIGTLGSLVGSVIAYIIGLKLGYPFLSKYGKYLFIDNARLMRLHNWFLKYGDIAVFSFRFVPEFRALISYPAGVAQMRIIRFLVFTVLGHSIWDVILSLLGYHYANQINYIITLAEKFGIYALAVTIILIIIYVILRIIKK